MEEMRIAFRFNLFRTFGLENICIIFKVPQSTYKHLKIYEPVVVKVGQPDHQLDVLLQEALSEVEHAHTELFFGDLSVTVCIKGP